MPAPARRTRGDGVTDLVERTPKRRSQRPRATTVPVGPVIELPAPTVGPAAVGVRRPGSRSTAKWSLLLWGH